MSNRRTFTLLVGSCILIGAVLGVAFAALAPSTWRNPTEEKKDAQGN